MTWGSGKWQQEVKLTFHKCKVKGKISLMQGFIIQTQFSSNIQRKLEGMAEG